MSDCSNVKKVFVPTDENSYKRKYPNLTFGATTVAIEKVHHFIEKMENRLILMACASK